MVWPLIIAAAAGAVSSASAARSQRRAAGEANALSASEQQQTIERNAPFYSAGVTALEQLQERMPELSNSQYDPQRLMQEPGYQFGLQQGLDGVQSTAAARGGLYSGNALRALTRYGTDYATTRLNDAHTRQMQGNQQSYNMLSGLANQGQAAANNTSAHGSQFASQAGQNTLGAGNASAANALAQGSIWGNAVNQWGAGRQTRPGSNPYGYNGTANNPSAFVADGSGQAGGGYARDDRNYEPVLMADGGAVRPPPVVGPSFERLSAIEQLREIAKRSSEEAKILGLDREPRGLARIEHAERKALGYADGGAVRTPPVPGAGMSPEAILRALDEAQAAGQAAGQRATREPGTIATLPANPVTQPAELRGRMRDAGEGFAAGGAVKGRRDMRKGGAVPGAGTGRADDVPAQLSAGEHVIDAETVALLGEGNTEAGHARLEELKQRIRAHAARA